MLIGRLVGPDELALVTGLVLVAIGFWDLWRPGAFLVPGAVLLWLALPARYPFVTRHGPEPETARRK